LAISSVAPGAAGGQRRGEPRPVVALAALDLLEFGDDLAASGRDVAGDRCALGVEAEAGAPLPLGADPVVGDEAQGRRLGCAGG